jgi:hypothetical protein
MEDRTGRDKPKGAKQNGVAIGMGEEEEEKEGGDQYKWMKATKSTGGEKEE